MCIFCILTARKIYWIGGSDAHIEGHWKWNVDFSNFTFKDWDRGEPGNHGGKEHCVLLYGTRYKWHDRSCSRKEAHVCETSTVTYEY